MIRDQLQRLVGEQASLVLRTPMGVDVDGQFSALDLERGRLMVELTQDPPPLSPDDAVTLFFTRNGQRWALQTSLHHFPRPASLVLLLPQAVTTADRRQEPRCRVEEGALRAVVKTSLYEGLTLEGPVCSLAASGFAFRVETVEGPSGRLPWRRGLLEPGRAFEAIQIQGLPMEVESEGRLLWVEEQRVGLRMRSLSGERREALAAYVQARAEVAPQTLEFGLEEPGDSRGVDDAAAAPRESPDRSQALLRLKKRGRTLALAMKPGHLRDALQAQLTGFGYGRVEAVDTLAQWLELIHGQLVDLVFIDGGLKELQGLELASFLHQARGERNYAIVLAEQLEGTSLGLVAKRAGVTQLVGKPYTLDARLDALLEGALDLRPQAVEDAAPAPSMRYKRKAIALAMPPGARRDALQAFLLSEGFCRVMAAGTVGELIRALQSPTLGLVFVDWEEANLSGLEVAAFLAAQHGATHPQLVLAGDPARLEEEARTLGVTKVLPRSYALNKGLASVLLEVMEASEAAGFLAS